MRYRDAGIISCAQVATDLLEGLEKKGAGQLSYREAKAEILDNNIVDGYFRNENDAMAFIAENLDEAVKTMSDYRMFNRYSARLDPLRDSISFSDAMIERKALEIARNGFREKPRVHISYMLDDDRSFDELVACVSGRMKNDLADGCSFDIISADSYSYGMDVAHSSEQEAAYFMMKNAEYYLKEYDYELTERSNFLSDVKGWEARVIGEKAVEGILSELKQAGVDIRDDTAVSTFYDHRQPALDEAIHAAAENNRSSNQGRTQCDKAYEEAHEY